MGSPAATTPVPEKMIRGRLSLETGLGTVRKTRTG
jgi:hypothetical protein